MSLRSLACALLPLFAVACAGVTDAEDVADHHDHDGAEEVGATTSALTATSLVSSAVTDSCSTTSVKALAEQLVQEIQCMKPGSMTRIDSISGLSLGSAVFPYLQTPAANALAVAQKNRGVTLTVNSGLRTLPQQYLLYRWYQTGRCGIGLAAKPGTSNHESGIAVDIADNSSWRSAMSSEGFVWLGSHDPVHFDFKAGGTIDMKGLSVLAFQRLWNRNNPNDKIGEDGSYGPATEARLAKSPVGGFAIGAQCTQTLSASLPSGDPSSGADTTSAGPNTAAEASEDDSTTTNTTGATPEAPKSVDSNQPTTEPQGCSMAPSQNGTNGTLFGAPLALGLLGLGLVLRRRRAA